MPLAPLRALAVVACAAVLSATATPALADDRSAPSASPSPSATAPAVPIDASDETKAALETAQQELARLAKEAAATKAAYVAATARLSLARQSAIDAARRADEAAMVATSASEQLGRLASNAYRDGPMAGAAAVLGSSSPFQLLHTASVISLASDHQSEVLRDLQQARSAASSAHLQAQQSQTEAATALADAKRLNAKAHRQLGRTVELLGQLQARADQEAQAAQQARLAAARASLRAGLGAAPMEATMAGPAPGLPADAAADPGDGDPGLDHLRPRAERAKFLITTLFGVTDIGGWRPSDAISDDHPNGKALDVMLSSTGLAADPAHTTVGWTIARWAQANATSLGVTYIIWQARIWSVARQSEGWRDYTANFPYGSQVNPTTLHLNHVHISFA